MSRNYTWGTIRDRIRMRVNKEKSQFVTDSEINGLMEESYADLYNTLVNENENYFISTTVINTVAGTDKYDLPSDFFKLIGIDIAGNDGFIRQMKQVPWIERNKYRSTVSYMGYPVDYTFYNNQIKLLPIPSQVVPLTVYYIPTAPVYTNDATTIDGISGFEKYIIYDVAATIRAKEQKDNTDMLEKRNLALAAMKQAISPRDFENAITVSDVIFYDV